MSLFPIFDIISLFAADLEEVKIGIYGKNLNTKNQMSQALW